MHSECILPQISKEVGFKIQNSKQNSGRIQDSRFPKRILESKEVGFKIQNSMPRKNFFNPTSLDSRFKIQGSEKASSIPPPWIQNSIFKAEGLRVQEVLLGS
jgi:hypothetical protein